MDNEMQDLFYQELGSRISQLRIHKQLTQAQLAEMLNMSRASIVNIEKGRQRPPIHLIWEIASHFEINPTELLSPLAYSKKLKDEKELLRQVKTQIKGDRASQKSVSEFIKKIS